MYDLIGDIHGCAQTLHALLEKLGYAPDGVCYRHTERQVIFLGDFIDRGPLQRETVQTAMAMVKHGAALSVMGNHEFNALGFHTQDPQDHDTFLRPREEKNVDQHRAFLDAYENDAAGRDEALTWFRSLPLWLELQTPQGTLRVVHACWDPESMKSLQPGLGAGNLLSNDLLEKASRKRTAEYRAVETLLKGKEVRLPNDGYFFDKDGYRRHEVRIQWWKESGTFQSLAMGPETNIPDDPVGVEHLITYGHTAYDGGPVSCRWLSDSGLPE